MRFTVLVYVLLNNQKMIWQLLSLPIFNLFNMRILLIIKVYRKEMQLNLCKNDQISYLYLNYGNVNKDVTEKLSKLNASYSISKIISARRLSVFLTNWWIKSSILWKVNCFEIVLNFIKTYTLCMRALFLFYFT